MGGIEIFRCVTYYSFSGDVVAVYPGELSRLQENEDTVKLWR